MTLDSAVRRIRKAHNVAVDTILDITVSFDGSWLTRGFSSMYGIGAVIEEKTGIVVYYEVLSLYCKACQNKNLLSGNELTKWISNHKDECDINFTGKSGAMEVYYLYNDIIIDKLDVYKYFYIYFYQAEIARRIWSRSLRKYNFRYVNMVSDGDSKAFNSLSIVCDYPVQKLECINHVSKRLGKALRLLKECGGRGEGRLTIPTKKKLQIYYANAVSILCILYVHILYINIF